MNKRYRFCASLSLSFIVTHFLTPLIGAFGDSTLIKIIINLGEKSVLAMVKNSQLSEHSPFWTTSVKIPDLSAPASPLRSPILFNISPAAATA